MYELKLHRKVKNAASVWFRDFLQPCYIISYKGIGNEEKKADAIKKQNCVMLPKAPPVEESRGKKFGHDSYSEQYFIT